MEKLRVGVSGPGLGRQRALGYTQNENAKLCAVCDINEKRIKQFTDENSGTKGYTDFETI